MATPEVLFALLIQVALLGAFLYTLWINLRRRKSPQRLDWKPSIKSAEIHAEPPSVTELIAIYKDSVNDGRNFIRAEHSRNQRATLYKALAYQAQRCKETLISSNPLSYYGSRESRSALFRFTLMREEAFSRKMPIHAVCGLCLLKIEEHSPPQLFLAMDYIHCDCFLAYVLIPFVAERLILLTLVELPLLPELQILTCELLFSACKYSYNIAARSSDYTLVL